MKKIALTVIFGAAAWLAALNVANAESENVKLIYPIGATQTTTVEKGGRAAPPVDEDAEVDVETPLGQVQSVLDALRRVERNQEELTEDVGKLWDAQKTTPDRTDEVLAKVDALRIPDLTGLATSTEVGGVLDQIAGIKTALDETVARAAALEEEAKAWRESLDNATAAIERLTTIKESKATTWLCWCVLGIVTLGLFVKAFKAIADKFAEMRRYANAFRQYQEQREKPKLQ